MCTPAALREAGGRGIDGQQQFEKFSGENTIRLSRRKQEKRLSCASRCPTPYDNYNGLVVGFCTGVRPSEAILSIAVMPRSVTPCFLRGKKTARSGKTLEGTRNIVRHIKMKSQAAMLDDPGVRSSVAQAVAKATMPIAAGQRRQPIIKPVSVKQRPAAFGSRKKMRRGVMPFPEPGRCRL